MKQKIKEILNQFVLTDNKHKYKYIPEKTIELIVDDLTNLLDNWISDECKKCEHNHISPRYAKDGCCKECYYTYGKQYYSIFIKDLN